MPLIKIVNGQPVEMTPEEEAEFIAQQQADAAVVRVPREITMRQARLTLLGAGLLDDVQPAIDSLPSPQKEAAQIEWEYSNTLQRANPFVNTLGPALGLTSQQIDELFIQGATL
jgi:hypothetical protein